MLTLVVRNLDEALIKALKASAVEHNRSTEAEHRAILQEILLKPKRPDFAEVLANMPDVGLDADYICMEGIPKSAKFAALFGLSD